MESYELYHSGKMYVIIKSYNVWPAYIVSIYNRGPNIVSTSALKFNCI
jgi:hypothetical protein